LVVGSTELLQRVIYEEKFSNSALFSRDWKTMLGRDAFWASWIFLTHAHLSKDVKFLASPWISMTSECRVERKIGVETPSSFAMPSTMAQNDRSRRIDVLCPFNRMFRVTGS
jgi:hypothetical protein